MDTYDEEEASKMKEFQITLAHELSKRMIEKHIDVNMLAGLSNTSASCIYQMQRGESNPTQMVLIKISTALGCEVDDLTHKK